MRSRLLILLPLLACAIPCIAQTAIKVTPCELIASPEKYAGKVVQVRARVDLAFEDFSLAQPGCEDKSPGVWLMYGGDEPTPTASTWNDHDRKPGADPASSKRECYLYSDSPIGQAHGPRRLLERRVDAFYGRTRGP